MTTDLADVKTQLQRQRAATHNATTEISGLVMLVKDQLTQEVNNSLVTVQRQVQQLSSYNIHCLTEEITQMKGAVKKDVAELTNETKQMTTDLADVKTQLQRQRAATHNATTEISGLVMLVKDQLTQEVNNNLVNCTTTNAADFGKQCH
jgi:metal-responsive CopG/Arc/MetJ family transcriptional regulator